MSHYHQGIFKIQIAAIIRIFWQNRLVKKRDAYDFMQILCKISMAFQNVKTISHGKALPAH
jgi:hypothetical protein